ncbi:MAG: ANTAR domain-containing protein [Pseudomonadota bacterium]
MSLESGGRVFRVLLVASDDQVQTNLREALSTHYRVEVAPDEPVFTIPSAAQPFDIILIVREAIDATYLNSVRECFEASPSAVVVFVRQDPAKLATNAIRAGVTSYVVDGYELNRVPTVLELSLERFKLQQALQDELQKSQEELAARKVIERAKGLLMEKKDLNEQDAYRSLRELAMRQSKSIREVSETLILYSDVLP